MIIFACHPRLQIDKIIFERGFGQSFEKLADISYLSANMLHYFDPVTAEQLKDCAIRVSLEKEKYTISELCSTKLKFASEFLIKWFNKKYKSQFLQLNLLKKKKMKMRINEIEKMKNV